MRRWVSALAPWLGATRPAMAVMSSLLIFVSFKLAGIGWHLAAHPAIAEACIACATMVWNDYTDRHLDKRRGKNFASRHEQTFRWYAIAWWITAAFATGPLYATAWPWGLVLSAHIVVGLLYPLTYPVLGLPALAVAFVAGSGVLLPATIEHTTPALWWLAVSAILILVARELLKDSDQATSDVGAKCTIATVWGSDTARLAARCGLIAAIAVLWRLQPQPVAALFLFIAAAGMVIYHTRYKWGRVALDAALIALLATILGGQS